MGVDPATITRYDDKAENMLVRTGRVTEVVMLDACNWPLPPSVGELIPEVRSKV